MTSSDAAGVAVTCTVGVGVETAAAAGSSWGGVSEPIATRPKKTATPMTSTRRRVSRRPVWPVVTGPATAGWAGGRFATGAPASAPSASRSRRQPWQKRNTPRRAVPHCGQNSDTDPPRVTVARVQAPDVKYVRMPAFDHHPKELANSRAEMAELLVVIRASE